jgi:MAF protein
MRPLRLVLGSTSPYRKRLLERLGLSFETASPAVDESPRPGESPQQLVLRLAEAKARAVGKQIPGSLVIGSDQVACVEDKVLGKPGDRVRAIEQLTSLSGRHVAFLTGLCLYNSEADRIQLLCEPFGVQFRELTPEQIAHYVDRERPFDCAGSFRSEGLGIALFERMIGDDPNALIGLPLIRLVDMLAREGVSVL